MVNRTLGVLLVLLFFAGIAGASGVAGASGERQVFIGVFREGAPRNMNFILQFEKQVGKKPAMVMWYQDWAQKFPAEEALNVVNYGAVPHIVWEPWYWGDTGTNTKVGLKNIIDGKWDGYILSWAKSIKEFGHPVFLRVAHEFNIEGYPWGIVNNDKNPETYVKAYRRIVDIFRREKVTNVKWVWAPMNHSFPDESWNDWVLAYPGDDYVDWIGFDGYNWGKTQTWSNWESFNYLFRDPVRRAKKLWPNKPMMIAEFASTEKGGDKAAWIKEISGYLKSSLREIDAIIWFDHKKETDWRINSTPAALAAFKAIMRDPLFSSSGELLSCFTPSLQRAEKKTAVALKNRGPVKIDGKLDEWRKEAPIIMADLSFLKEGTGWAGPSDLSGKAYLMWDEENLYLAAEITDKISPVNNKERAEIWNGDGVEIVLGLDPKADQKRTTFGRGDYQLGFGAGNSKGNQPSIWNWQRRRVPTGSEITVSKTAQVEGYILEAKIPWEFFREFTPHSGAKVGFDIAFDDADQRGERERQFIWNGDFSFYQDPSVWGVLELKD